MERIMKKHPVVSYYLLVISISWLGLFFIIGPKAMLGLVPIDDQQMAGMMLAMILGPLLASSLLISFTEGKKGWKHIREQLFNVRVSVKWYLIALVSAPVITLLTIVILSQFSEQYLPLILEEKNVLGLVLGGLIGGLVAGFFEEMGWTYVVTQRLLKQYSFIRSGLYLGFVWGLWHLPLFSTPDPSGQLPQILLIMVKLMTQLPVFRIWMTYVYKETNSLMIAVIMHMMLTASTIVLQTQITTGYEMLVFNVTWSVLLLSVLFLVRLYYKRKSFALKE